MAWAVFLAGAGICSGLIAFQAMLSPTFGFFALLLSGLALGALGFRMRDSVIAAFLMGYVAYAIGSVASVVGQSLIAGYPLELVTAYTAIAILVGLVFGTVAGIWTAGGAAVGFVVRRKPHAGHLL